MAGSTLPLRVRHPALRTLRVFAATAHIAWEFWALGRKRRGCSEQEFEQLRQALFRRQAVRIRRLCVDLQGLWIKLGQFLSTRADVLPSAYTSELSQLQDLVPPFPGTEAEGVIAAAYGKPLPEVFASFDPEPVAAASLGQVHRGTLPSGETVAIKVLRPGIERIVDTDLRTALWIARAATRWTRFGRRVDLLALHGDLAHITGQEMDYTIEAEHARRFRANLSAQDPVSTPAIHQDLVRQRVLVMEFVEGLRVDRPEALRTAGIDPKAVARNLVRSYLRQVLEDGFFHADPHPGNLFVGPAAHLIFVDFGMMAEVSPTERQAFTRLVAAAISHDLDGIVAAIRNLGFLRPGAEAPVLKKALGMALDQLSGLPMDKPDSAEFQAFLSDMHDFLYTEPFQLPARYAYLGRAVGILLGITTSLDPDLKMVPLLKEAALPLLGLSAVGALSPARPGHPAAPSVWGVVRDSLLTAYRLPQRIERLAERAEEGEVHVRVDVVSLERKLDLLLRATRRLGFALLGGCAAISAALLTGAHRGFPAVLLWAFAGILALLSFRRR